MKAWKRVVGAVAVAWCGALAGAEQADLPAGGITVVTHVGAKDNETVLDVLAPVSGDNARLLMLNPRGSLLSGPEEEANLGVVYRRMFEDPFMIVGGNLFYDSRWTRYGHHFNQLGAGVEALSRWIDFRFNYYLPEKGRKIIREWEETSVDTTTTRRRGRRYHNSDGDLIEPIITTRTTTITTTRYTLFEEAMQGYDVELGTALEWLPEWLDTSLFAGYYNFWSEYSGRLDGFRGRLEVRPVKAVFIDAVYYTDPELNDSRYVVGARLRVPFDFWNMRRGGSAFEGTREAFRAGRRSLDDRMTDMVIRDFRCRTSVGTSSTVVNQTTTTGTSTQNQTIAKGDDDDDDGPPEYPEGQGY